MSKLSQRFSLALAAGRAAGNPQSASAKPKTSGQNYHIVLTRGLSVLKNRQAVLDIQKSGDANQTVILVTDQRDIDLYQLRDCITEHLIADHEFDDQIAGPRVKTYIRERLEILNDKWQPHMVVGVGDNAQKLVDSLGKTSS